MATQRAGIGTPPIATPPVISLPVLQQMASNIRERFERVEAHLRAIAATSTAPSSASSAASIQLQLSAIQADIDRLSAQAGGGLGSGDGAALLQTADNSPPPAAINDATAILAARVFGA
jgi:hypothetical protein